MAELLTNMQRQRHSAAAAEMQFNITCHFSMCVRVRVFLWTDNAINLFRCHWNAPTEFRNSPTFSVQPHQSIPKCHKYSLWLETSVVFTIARMKRGMERCRMTEYLFALQSTPKVTFFSFYLKILECRSVFSQTKLKIDWSSSSLYHLNPYKMCSNILPPMDNLCHK